MKNQGYLNNLLAAHLHARRRNSQTTVRFCEYVTGQLPHENPGGMQHWERSMHKAIEEIVIKLLGHQVLYGYHKICRPWTEVVQPCDLEKCESKDRFSEPKERDRVGLDDTRRLFYDATFPFPTGFFEKKMVVDDLYDTMVMPMACAFVHKTAWRTSLVRFCTDSEAWLESVKLLGREFCDDSDKMKKYITHREKNDWSNLTGKSRCAAVSPDDNEFWTGYEETQHLHAKQFYSTLVHYTRRMANLIRELNKDFPENSHPMCLESIVMGRVWEQLVLDWVHDSKRREVYFFFYGTGAEFYYHKLRNIPFGGHKGIL